MKKSNILQLLIVIIGIVSITINFILFKDWKGIFYYTIISNTYVTLLYGVSLCLSLRNKLVKNNTYYMMKGLMLLSIMCTMFIFFFVVGSKDGVYSGHPVECLTVHLLMPVLAMLECLLFENKKVLKYKYLINWVAISAMYLLLIIVYRLGFNGTFLEGKKYPYDVINFEDLGIVHGTINCLAILLFFIIVGSIIIFVDNKMKKPLLEDK